VSGADQLLIYYVGITYLTLGAILYFLIKRIPPNIFIGLRIGFTFISREVWSRVNREYGASLVALGTAVILLNYLGLPPNTLLNVSVGAAIVITLVFIIRAYRLADYYATMKVGGGGEGVEVIKPLKLGSLRTALAIAPPILITASLILTYPILPNQVATHFGPNGLPNGFTSKYGFLTFVTPLILTLSLLGLASVILGMKLPIAFYNPWTTMGRFFIAVTDLLIATSWVMVLTYVSIVTYNVLGRHILDPGLVATTSSLITVLLGIRVIYVCLIKRSKGTSQA